MNLRSLALPLLILTMPIARGEWAYLPDVEVPISRVLPTLERRVKEKPGSAQLHYLLGRVHSLAFAMDEGSIRVVKGTEKGKNPEIVDSGWVYRDTPPMKAWTEKSVAHLQKTIQECRLAVKLAPKEKLYQMGLGWALEVASADAKRILNRTNRETAIEAASAYREVVNLSYDADMKATIEGPSPFYSVEAAEGYVRLVKKFPEAGGRHPERESNAMAALAQKVRNKPRAVTPIVVPLYGENSLAQLLDGNRTTRFDIAGDGVARTWPWVRATTGLLVWDPSRTGKIESGCSLFGNATWWMFFRNGYEALSTLDGDGNGWLEKRELDGIRIWIDGDQDGRSRSSEVIDLGSLGIVGLRVKEDGADANGPFARNGVRWLDSRLTPSFDWIAHEIGDRERTPPRPSCTGAA